MANPLKQLAGETAIYGLSTILARIINFLLVPLYTRVLLEADYGVVTEFMAYIAILQVVLVLGLETGCFRYAGKEGADPKAVFSNAFIAVFTLCAIFFGATTLFSDRIAALLGYEGFANVIIYVGAILLMDCTTAIIFAKLRHEHRAVSFALIKTIKILTEVCANLLLYLVMPARIAANPGHWMLNFVSATPDFTYAIFAIFISCVVCVIMLIPQLFQLRWNVDRKLLGQLLIYSLPLMIAGLPGVLNDFVDRVLMRFLNADPAMWRADLGVYQAGVKIAVIMQLFIQMFRYAAEPFFFQRAKDKGSKELYAKVMNYFVAFCMFGFLCVTLYIDQIGLILGKNFRGGLSIAPIMLMAYVALGMLFNVNMWYKLSGKTGYAIWITLAGLAVTIVVNAIWMPRFSYHAAAWAHLLSYVVMLTISVLLGNKYYKIPYNWLAIASIIVFGFGFYAVGTMLPDAGLPMWGDHAARAGMVVVYSFLLYLLLKRYNKAIDEGKDCQ